MKTRPPSAFTLLEILVAVALLGALLLALNVFIFSMGEIWGRNSEQRLFEQHVRAVTRHVEKLLRTAALSPGALAGAARPLTVQEIRVLSGATEPGLSFELPESDRMMTWADQPLPDVVCALGAHPGQGLVLYWHSRLEKHFTDQPPRATVLSIFGAGLSYEYYQPDFKAWQSQPTLQKDRDGKWRLPDRLTLRFVHGKMSAETTVALPAATDGLPAF